MSDDDMNISDFCEALRRLDQPPFLWIGEELIDLKDWSSGTELLKTCPDIDIVSFNESGGVTAIQRVQGSVEKS